MNQDEITIKGDVGPRRSPFRLKIKDRGNGELTIIEWGMTPASIPIGIGLIPLMFALCEIFAQLTSRWKALPGYWLGVAGLLGITLVFACIVVFMVRRSRRLVVSTDLRAVRLELAAWGKTKASQTIQSADLQFVIHPLELFPVMSRTAFSIPWRGWVLIAHIKGTDFNMALATATSCASLEDHLRNLPGQLPMLPVHEGVRISGKQDLSPPVWKGCTLTTTT